MRRISTLFMLLILNFLFSVSIFSQEHEGPPPEDNKSHRMIEAIKIWKLTEFLDLDEEQMVTFFPKLKKIENHRRTTFRERRKKLLKLKELLDKEKSDKKIKNMINDIIEFDKEQKEEEEKLREEVMSVLTVKQQAKFLLFEERFGEAIRKIIKNLGKTKRMEP